MDQALTALGAAREKRDAAEVERQKRKLRSLVWSARSRDPERPYYLFEWCEAHVAETNDPQRAAALLEEGRKAVQAKDTAALRAILRKLDDLFPGDAEDRRLSFGSGIW